MPSIEEESASTGSAMGGTLVPEFIAVPNPSPEEQNQRHRHRHRSPPHRRSQNHHSPTNRSHNHQVQPHHHDHWNYPPPPYSEYQRSRSHSPRRPLNPSAYNRSLSPPNRHHPYSNLTNPPINTKLPLQSSSFPVDHRNEQPAPSRKRNTSPPRDQNYPSPIIRNHSPSRHPPPPLPPHPAPDPQYHLQRRQKYSPPRHRNNSPPRYHNIPPPPPPPAPPAPQQPSHCRPLPSQRPREQHSSRPLQKSNRGANLTSDTPKSRRSPTRQLSTHRRRSSSPTYRSRQPSPPTESTPSTLKDRKRSSPSESESERFSLFTVIVCLCITAIFLISIISGIVGFFIVKRRNANNTIAPSVGTPSTSPTLPPSTETLPPVGYSSYVEVRYDAQMAMALRERNRALQSTFRYEENTRPPYQPISVETSQDSHTYHKPPRQLAFAGSISSLKEHFPYFETFCQVFWAADILEHCLADSLSNSFDRLLGYQINVEVTSLNDQVLHRDDDDTYNTCYNDSLLTRRMRRSLRENVVSLTSVIPRENIGTDQTEGNYNLDQQKLYNYDENRYTTSMDTFRSIYTHIMSNFNIMGQHEEKQQHPSNRLLQFIAGSSGCTSCTPPPTTAPPTAEPTTPEISNGYNQLLVDFNIKITLPCNRNATFPEIPSSYNKLCSLKRGMDGVQKAMRELQSESDDLLRNAMDNPRSLLRCIVEGASKNRKRLVPELETAFLGSYWYYPNTQRGGIDIYFSDENKLSS